MTEQRADIQEYEFTVVENSGSEKVILIIPANIKYLETVSACLSAVLDRVPVPLTQETQFSLKLAVHEACTNVIEHAYRWQSGQLKIVLEVFGDPSKIVIDILDQGAAADLSHVTEPDFIEPQVKGYGLYLIRKLVDEVEYSRENGVNRWRFVKAL